MKLVDYSDNLLNSQADCFLLYIEKYSCMNDRLIKIAELNQVINKIHNVDKKCYLVVNRFLFEDEIVDCIQFLDFYRNLVDGYYIFDFGILKALRSLGNDLDIIINTNTTMTNHLDIKVLLDCGANYVVLARELTLEELLTIGNKLNAQVIVPIFGHQIISSSRRLLLDSYNQELNLNLKSNYVYSMIEESRHDPFLLFQDQFSTNVFDGKVLNGIEYINLFRENNIQNFLFDGFNLSDNLLLKALNEEYLEIDDTNGLWFKKTSERKEK